MVDPTAKPCAVVPSLEVGGERGYGVVTWVERSEDPRVVGYWRALRAACEAAHRHRLARQGPEAFAGYPDFQSTRASAIPWQPEPQ